mmetsp:Transcript_9485/g.13870  ORF Transcript_9485/g.13870 Transcript_9485/m.13870 type:complete len:466 (+) Transcript_9485:61-1458(+)
MVLTRRTARPTRTYEGSRLDVLGKSRKNRASFVAPLTIIAVIVALVRIILKLHKPPTYPDMPENAKRIEEKVGLSLDLRRSNKRNYTMGPHEATLVIGKPCKDSRFFMRLIGDEALVSLPIVQVNKHEWKGKFEIPFPGNYVIEPRWYGCQDALAPSKINQLPYKGESTRIFVGGHRQTRGFRPLTQSHTSVSNLFSEGFWASPNLYDEDMPNSHFWITREMGLKEPNYVQSSTELGDSMVAREASPIPEEFNDLSNYELLCWIGSRSAELIWESFKSLRPFISKNQKPSKFHYYPMHSFVKPDEEWNDETKKRFRKCKNIIISVDELSYPITQEEYKHQVAVFLNHLVKAFDDATFPIWLLTVNLPATSFTPTCTSPLLRTNHHPCNDALFDLFSSSRFPNRVQLLDNTDLTSPLLEDDSIQDAIAVIAMRIFAIAGTQVKAWRAAGQRGIKEGSTTRNNKRRQ